MSNDIVEQAAKAMFEEEVDGLIFDKAHGTHRQMFIDYATHIQDAFSSDLTVEAIAEHLFNSVIHYHKDLKWHNASDWHKGLFIRYASAAKPLFHDYYCVPDCDGD